MSSPDLLSPHLSGAVGRDELSLALHPVVETAGGHLSRFETLLRWQHPVHGLIAPAATLAAAESGGWASGLALWTVEKALAHRAAWAQRAATGVSVNLSCAQLADPGLAHGLERILAEAAVDPALLTLEVPTSEALGPSLADLDALGVRLALDDLGTAPVSMTELRRLPLDEVKIDVGVVRDAAAGGRAGALLRALADVAGALDLPAVAEGVERDEHWRMVAETGCELAQGYFVARPFPAVTAATWIEEWEGRRSTLHRGTARPRLTARERDILAEVVRGLDNQEIATKLGLALNTVRGYVQQMIEKLGVHSRLALVLEAKRAGLIRPD